MSYWYRRIGLEKWGYVRVSVDRITQAAGWEDQIATLKGLDCTRFFYEEASTRGERPEFERMLAEANRSCTARSSHLHLCRKDGSCLP